MHTMNMERLTMTRTLQVHSLCFRRDGSRGSIIIMLILLMQCDINDSELVRCHNELVRCLRVSDSFIP